ncbi:ORF152 [Alphabaculovirus altermyunipunctae]|uniref:ORF152 n=1 Tax=Mythimna unipuncta nucleopolyhedrovirus TaxID=447897 RepID=A0A346TPT8_9ABAC|nr:ORF152 [Mythimna unipuncta nucleopolyhedrovirus]AXU41598.1 ORF152 [Mythimna unipuncta nucleopolyhedrovirus]
MDTEYYHIVSYQPFVPQLYNEVLRNYSDMLLGANCEYMVHCHPVIHAFARRVHSINDFQKEFHKDKLRIIKLLDKDSDAFREFTKSLDSMLSYANALQIFWTQRRLILKLGFIIKTQNTRKLRVVIGKLLKPFQIEPVSNVEILDSAYSDLKVVTCVLKVSIENDEGPASVKVRSFVSYNSVSRQLLIHMPQYVCNLDFWMNYIKHRNLTRVGDHNGKYCSYANKLKTFCDKPIIHSFVRRNNADTLIFDCNTRPYNNNVPMTKVDFLHTPLRIKKRLYSIYQK